MHVVRLTPSEIARARKIGIARDDACRRAGRTSHRVALNRTDQEICIIGAMAEMAVSVAEHRPIMTELVLGRNFRQLTSRPDVGCWEVKYSGSRPPILSVPVHLLHKQNAEYYLLVSGRPAEMMIIGWITADELFQRENIKQLKYSTSYVAPYLWPYFPPDRRDDLNAMAQTVP